MRTDLERLVGRAAWLAGMSPCDCMGHEWVSDGCRGCPEKLTEMCGQAVYVCDRCGIFDYGDKGGPGHADCERYCRHRDDVVVEEEADG